MPFIFKKLLDHGTTNPIVPRLSLQILTFLKQCDVSQEVSDKVGQLYMHSLQPRLLRCWEIQERFREEFNGAISTYSSPTHPVTQIPQVSRLEAECHNFLYEAKNYIRDTLLVVNALYGTGFKEASEFSRTKKPRLSLVDWAGKTIGANEARTKLFREAVPCVELIINARNAVEHPGGYSGTLHIENFNLEPDGRLAEPMWHRTKDGRTVMPVSSLRADLDGSIHNLLVLGESVFVSWTSDHLKMPNIMQIVVIPEEHRNPVCPVKYQMGLGANLQQKLHEIRNKQ